MVVLVVDVVVVVVVVHKACTSFERRHICGNREHHYKFDRKLTVVLVVLVVLVVQLWLLQKG